MRFYAVVSEHWTDHYQFDPPETGCIAEIVVAERGAQARYLALKSDRVFRGMSAREWPRMRVRALADAPEQGTPRVLAPREAEPFWAMVPEGWPGAFMDRGWGVVRESEA